MIQIMVLSLFTGSLGWQALLAAQWVRWRQHLQVVEQEEEEILTLYQSKDDPVPKADPIAKDEPATSKPDLRSLGWEFKILRAQSKLFDNPKLLKQVCDEEAEAGWILLEKLDDQRLRFKRPMFLRDQPTQSKYDPYRCFYGSRYSWSTLGSLLILALTIVLPAYLGYTLVTLTLNQKQPQPEMPSPEIPSPEIPSPPESPLDFPTP
ncbi:MAG: hypothetical protein KME35_14795 [Aphanocapsa sp. GSE-SYN-MK-11-07L]|jgi:hypothetical protein|nr:hypothetical protein [Aphanocapsa sp. GSE-SYN-MK-11-07L]